MDLNKLYDEIMELQAVLEQDHDDPDLQIPDYRKVQALAATYTLQDYLSNAIAAAVKAGEMEPEEEGIDNRREIAESLLGILPTDAKGKRYYTQEEVEQELGLDKEVLKELDDVDIE